MLSEYPLVILLDQFVPCDVASEDPFVPEYDSEWLSLTPYPQLELSPVVTEFCWLFVIPWLSELPLEFDAPTLTPKIFAPPLNELFSDVPYESLRDCPIDVLCDSDVPTLIEPFCPCEKVVPSVVDCVSVCVVLIEPPLELLTDWLLLTL